MTYSTNRRDRLPKDWKRLRQIIIHRDRGVCVLCGERGTDVDHIEPGDDHRLDNLRLLCRVCHNRKSGSEGGHAKARNGRFHQGKHPGLK